ncbi:biogenesis of lysosome-related organelles complex 1 subunit 2-like [Monomorium pharaonis]|uniref:biogenesis of lysosome-related organelles complex 1 subunit 2-like n=1 Tax=Monomorium pharaonis TaxID=307658 RepID=UPI00063F0595|nr:biogenesis of lysosome-related organelles complex 1 subunit 2-like [Monomorium pharaonis]
MLEETDLKCKADTIPTIPPNLLQIIDNLTRDLDNAYDHIDNDNNRNSSINSINEDKHDCTNQNHRKNDDINDTSNNNTSYNRTDDFNDAQMVTRSQIHGIVNSRDQLFMHKENYLYFMSTDEWDKLVRCAAFSYNTSTHEATGYTPYELVFGKLARLPSNEITNDIESKTSDAYLTQLMTDIHNLQELARENVIASKLK